MSEDLSIQQGTKEEQYESLLPQIAALLEGEPDLVANMANTVAALKEQFGWLWIGFYVVKNESFIKYPKKWLRHLMTIHIFFTKMFHVKQFQCETLIIMSLSLSLLNKNIIFT